MYCNLLQCSHFSSTSILAESEGDLCGFISGYYLPDQPDVLFVWQVAVAPECRGQGLAIRMLRALTERLRNEVHFVHTSITDTNRASWKTFRRLARELEAPLSTRVMFARDTHFEGEHDTETLVCIGPFNLTDTAEGIAQSTLTES